MHVIYCCFAALVLVTSVNTIKMNIEGRISVGKDIMDSVADFMESRRLSARRSLIPVVEEDSITSIVRTAVLCKDLPFCFPLRKFTEEYVIVLAKAVHKVLSAMLGDSFKMFIFEGQLKQYLETVRNILETANNRVNAEKETYYWIDSMKRICAKFQELASIFVYEESQIDPAKISKLKKELSHKLIIAIVLIEIKYQTKLCKEHDICVKSTKVTNALNNILERFSLMPEEKVKLFIKYFYETLFDSGFYSHINEVTAHELQLILNDMAYSKELSTKEILSNVHEIVAARLKSIKTGKDEKLSHDAFLIHGILSDMDHIYSARDPESFDLFFQNFPNWIDNPDFRIDKQIRLVMQDIGKELWNVTDELLIKLINEVKIFLELTVDAEKLKNA